MKINKQEHKNIQFQLLKCRLWSYVRQTKNNAMDKEHEI